MQMTVEIDCPPDEVYDYVTDPENFPAWQSDVVRVQVGAEGARSAGTTFTTIRRIGGVEREMTQKVTEAAAPYRWTSVGVSGPVRPAAGIVVIGLDDGRRSEVTFTLDFEGHGLGVALLPLVRRQAEKAAPASYARAKHHLESRR
jgi:uncharacterized protein YndB with AHSA1/START domain